MYSKKFLNLNVAQQINRYNMKIFLFLISFLVSITALFSQTNSALYAIDNINTVCLANNAINFYGVVWNDKAVLKTFNFLTGEVEKEFDIDLPENPIILMVAHPKKDILYLITSKKIDDTKNRYIDAVYSINTKRDKLNLLCKSHNNYKEPNKIGMVGNNLVFTTPLEPTYLFNLKSNGFQLLNPNTHYQLLSIAPEQNGYLMLNINEVSKGEVPVYFMNDENNMSSRIGYVNPQVTIQSEVRIIQVPTITVEDSAYSWMANAIRYNCFPVYDFQIFMRPFWLKQFYRLDKVYLLSGILAANKTFMIMRLGKSILVYNYMEPHNSESANLTEEDVAKIEDYLSERNSYVRTLMSSDMLTQVFDGLFYQVYSENSFKYIAVQQHGNYSELKDYNQLVPLLKTGFKLNDRIQAEKFQESINILFPVDDFNKKQVINYKEANNWVFVRGIAFENKFGIIVKLNDEQKVLEIEYKSEL